MTATKPTPTQKEKKLKQPPCPHPENMLRAWGEDFTITQKDGLYVPDELKELHARPGFLKALNNGPGQRAKNLYCKHSLGFYAPRDLSQFGQFCYMGMVKEVIAMVESGNTPPLNRTETAYEAGYATIVVWGSQRVLSLTGKPTQHLQVLQFLIARGVPVNQRDIQWLTPVHHYMMNPHYDRRNTPMLELLLKSGASPNAQDKLGTVPIISAFDHNYVEAIELLIHHGADLDFKDGDGLSPMDCYVKFGPIVSAAVQKGLRKRAGLQMHREDKSCDSCRAADKPLKCCSSCFVALYCSAECQKKHWKEHKSACRAFAESDTVTVKPFYDENYFFKSISDTTRTLMGTPAFDNIRQSTEPKVQEPKHIIVKIQVPDEPTFSPDGNMLVYTKKKTEFICLVRRRDNVREYDRLYTVIKDKGVTGLKAYFSATIYSKDKLEVKISEVLAPQPF